MIALPSVRSFLYALVTIFLCSFGRVAHAQTEVLFVLDASGSMKQTTGGKRQIDAAREALAGALAELPPEASVGLRVYAHREDQGNKAKSCLDSELVVPLGSRNSASIIAAAAKLDPRGFTPIAYSLEQARSDFPSANESKKVIVLLSDGEETCGGDPAGAIVKLRNAGFEVTLHVVGFNVGKEAEKQLRAAAEAGKGLYFPAADPESLANAMREAAKAAAFPDKPKSVYGAEIQGGNSFETAVALQLGTEYRLNHHQKKGDYDYFFLNAKRGDSIVVTIKTLEKGAHQNVSGNFDETDAPYAGAAIHDEARKQLATKEVIGRKFEAAEVAADAATDGKYFVLIGNIYEAMHKDHATFVVQSIAHGDLGLGSDAGDGASSALPIEPNRYSTNFLGGSDQRDVYSFSGKRGEVFQAGFIPGDGFEGLVSLTIYDEFKEHLARKDFPQAQGGRTDPVTLKEDGKYYLELTLQAPLDKLRPYAFELKKVDMPAAVPGASPLP